MSEQNLMDAPSHDASGDYDSGDFGNESYSEFEGAAAGPNGQPAPGMGQSKSSRRRRRKRKNKQAANEPGAPTTGGSPEAPIVMEGESLALAASASAPAPQQQQPQQRRQDRQDRQDRGPQQRNNNNNNGGGSSSTDQGKRWKKKFRDRERRPRNENPGNEANPEPRAYSRDRDHRPDNFGNLAGGFKRKNKSGGGQSKDRGFVGPMDHSYREASPEFGDAPPSTIQMHGHGRRNGHRHHGDNQPIDHSMPRPVPIPENAQTHIYFFIEELFFVAKIQETARKLGVKVAFMKGESKDVLAELTSGEEINKPALIVFDLNNANAKPMTMIPKLKAKLKRSVSIIGFLSHLQGDLKAKAVEAGCDVVMPRSAFSQGLPNLLRRYGAEEEEEVNFNY